jgi:hypothetical protein
MRQSYLHLKFIEFKQKIKDFLYQTKKVRALENYLSCAPIPMHAYLSNRQYLNHITELLKQDFIDPIEERYLNDRIASLEIDALTWAHKTPWVKREMANLRQKRVSRKQDRQSKKEASQIMFPFVDLDKKHAIAVPLNVLVAKSKQQQARV